MTNNIFFSDENYKHICNQINQSVEFTFGISIEDNNKYQNKILDTMKCIYSNRLKFNIPLGVSEQEQSIILSNKSVKYFMIYFEKNLNKTYETADSRGTYLNQPEMGSLYGREYSNTPNYVTPAEDGEFMKLDLGEQPFVISNEYDDSSNLSQDQEEINTEETLNASLINTQPDSKDMTKFEKEVGQLFYALKDSSNFKVNKYNLVVDTGDCVWNTTSDNTPFNINVRFGMPNNNYSNQYGNNLYIKNSFKNIHSLKINRVIIPAKLIKEYMYPFLYLCIEEYESNVVTTGDIKNIFAKMYLIGNTGNDIGPISDGAIADPLGGFLNFINMEGDIKIFKAPLSQLSKLSISLVNPNGDILCIHPNTNSNPALDDEPTCPSSSTYTPYHHVQYMFELSTIENYIPHINSFPFNT